MPGTAARQRGATAPEDGGPRGIDEASRKDAEVAKESGTSLGEAKPRDSRIAARNGRLGPEGGRVVRLLEQASGATHCGPFRCAPPANQGRRDAPRPLRDAPRPLRDAPRPLRDAPRKCVALVHVQSPSGVYLYFTQSAEAAKESGNSFGEAKRRELVVLVHANGSRPAFPGNIARGKPGPIQMERTRSANLLRTQQLLGR
jgi:hypothetical protein